MIESDGLAAVIANWMRNRDTLEFLGLWESLHNSDFKPLEFGGGRLEAGLNVLPCHPENGSKPLVQLEYRLIKLRKLILKQLQSLEDLETPFINALE